MKFSHSILLNDPHNPQLPSLTRQQLWLGLVLRAQSPTLFIPHLDQCLVRDASDAGMTRELHYGKLVIHDRVTLQPLQQVRVDVPAQGEIATSSLVMRIAEPQPGVLWLHFEYDDGQDAATDAANEMYNQYRCAAYVDADTSTVALIRELAAQGKLAAPAP